MSKDSKAVHIAGTVVAVNLTSEGHVDGALVRTADGIVQVNFPRHGAHALRREMTRGAEVELSVAPVPGAGAHPVYRALHEETEIEGTIAALNYSREGEVNGYQLEDGTLVHLGAAFAKNYDFRVGDEIAAQGSPHAAKKLVVLEACIVRSLANGRMCVGDAQLALDAASSTTP